MHYVCSDIHGQYDLYRRLLEKLDLQESDTLYIIGDVIDRGPDSVSILRDIMARKNVELFLGNHELMMLDHYAGTGMPASWERPNNGGTVTMLQLEELPEYRREAFLSFVENAWLQKYVVADGTEYALHHSYWLPAFEGKDVRYSDVGRGEWKAIFDAVWYSPYRLFEYVPPERYRDRYIHIIGHVPVQMIPPDVRQGETVLPPYTDADGHIINIDGGCALISRGGPGCLYCMSLEKDEEGRRREYLISPDNGQST